MAKFSQMYEQYAEQVYCFLCELSGDKELAEELAGETFYQAFLHMDSFENNGSVFGWLCEIGKSEYLKAENRKKRKFPKNRKRYLTFTKNPRFETLFPVPADESGKEIAAERQRRIRQGLRRIRQRWICSVLAVAAVILSALMGVALLMGGVFEK